jgi:K+-sensing histidine kinase KdpD
VAGVVLGGLRDGICGTTRRRLTYEEVEHELKTPLTTIRSVSEILRDCPELSPEERRRLLAVLLDENARLTGAVDRLLGHPALQEVLA